MSLYVNNQEVSDSLAEMEYNRLLPEHRRVFGDMSEDERKKQLTEWSRENLIERTLLQQEAGSRAEVISEETLAAELKKHGIASDKADAREQAELHLKVARLLEDLCKELPGPTEEEMHRHYGDNAEKYAVPEQIHASHIVKRPRPGQATDDVYVAMMNLRESLLKGADFAQMAGQHSDCNDQGGDLGFFPRGVMVQQFDNVAFALAPDQLSEVFLTDFGYHILKVHEKQPAHTVDFAKARKHILKELSDKQRDERIASFVDELKAAASIEDRE